ncbi:hypothetical protein F4779DRAFT_567921 [Xylariaceae sp. FL0662B]|nr:hypothetical protein F4779DRAFT_567921 [Xylariaceae sp. FL0662B]
MVWIVPPSANPARLNAYIVTPIPDDALKRLKERFEHGAALRYNPALELMIQHAPAEYLGRSHTYIRTKETGAGREGPFVIIDKHAITDSAVWYVDDFADEDMVGNDSAESESVLLQILVKTSMLAIVHVNNEIANMTVDEELIHCGVGIPFRENFVQPEIYGASEDEDDERCAFFRDGEVVAESDEIEESTDEDILNDMMPRPDVVARLKPDIAKKHGVISDWTWKEPAEPVELGDGTVREFPAGNVTLHITYDFRFPWPEYKWPEGSL